MNLAKKLAESIPPLKPGEGPAEYVVQPGDTLWDIADQLLDDAMWWPRLWVLNPEVTDPDKIEPGMKLLFYPSTGTRAPELAVQDIADPFGAPKVELATLQTFSMNVSRWIGPQGDVVDPANLPGDQNLLTVGEPTVNATYMIRLPGLLSATVANSVAEIVSNPNSPMLAGQGRNLIARFYDRPPNPGERFLALKQTSLLTHLEPIKADGELYTYTGIVGVVRSSPSGYALMVAEDSGAEINPSDVLIPLNKNLYVPIDPNAPGRPNTAPAVVVATEDGTYTHAGPGRAVYLQGTDGRNPFSVGDDVELFMPQGDSYGFSDELVTRDRVALARVVDVNPDSAVAIILKASREVSTGASTQANLADLP